MKVGIVHPIFESAMPPSHQQISSLSIISAEIARRLAKFHDVTIYSRGYDHTVTEVIADNIRYRYFTRSFCLDDFIVKIFRVSERMLDYPLPKRPFFSSRWHYCLFALQVALDCHRQHLDVIHIISFSPLAAIIRWFNPDACIVLHAQQEWLTQIDHMRIRRYLRAADAVIACSDFVAKRSRDAYPDYAEQVYTVHNGVDITRFSQRTAAPDPDSERPRRIVYVGRVSAEKGLHILSAAFERVLQAIPNVHLDILGPAASPAYEYLVPIEDDPNVQALKPYFTRWLKRGDERYLAKLKQDIPPEFADRIHFLGGRPNSEVRQYLERADIFCFPPVWHEPFGIPVVEAMATGVPVVTTASGGIMEIVQNEETALVVPRADVEALAEALLRLLRDPALGQRLAAAARPRAETLFNWDESVKEIIDVYGKITSKPFVGNHKTPIYTH